MSAAREHRNGLLATTLAFVIWGLVPLYWRLLIEVPSLQIIAHRIVWSAVLLIGGLALARGWGWLRAVWETRRRFWLLGLASALISANWSLYIWAVNAGHVVETSLGYFINPLFSVVLGVAVLGERLRRLQWLAVALAALGVAWLTWQSGRPPWIALGLSVTFGLYGLIRKLVAVEAVTGLGVESLFMVAPAVAFVLWSEHGHGGGFASGWGWGNDLLLVFGGVVSAVPLIAFAYGVRRIPLSLVGLLQYIGPTLQLLVGVLVLHESFGFERRVGFALIWLGLLVFVGDAWRRTRRERRARALNAIDSERV
ncbi:EamA family transporter RarD [Stenotrophomonas mori]|uniref:EamA family transporter RarD n=1 Tax=Stenotrophomonas mori TaxID=2871096 RepID=A0ABT0SHW4_9GAMM|nr:EamA family transporter RarD [Stenotrophomonas mori]MCL7714590.1 EamA family transporter RarD [Stenotrophomonas mori]